MIHSVLIGILIVSLLITVYLGIIITIRCESKHIPMYIAMLMVSFLHIFGYLLEITAQSTDGGLVANRVLYLGVIYIAPCILVISAAHCEVKISRIAYPFIFIIPLVFLILVWTSSFHQLVYTSYEFVTNTDIPHLEITRGPLYFIPHIHTFSCVIVSVFFIVRKIVSSARQYRARFVWLLLATINPILFNVLYVMGLRIFGIDYTPLAVIASNIMFYIAITRYGFLDFVPLATEMALHSIKEAYILIDKNHNYLYANESAKILFPDLSAINISSHIKQVKNWPDIFPKANEKEPLHSITFELPGNFHYRAGISEIRSKKEDVLGYIILIQDITDSILYAKNIETEKRKAEEANKSKSNFLATMSHEIRTPMNAIIGIAQMLLQKSDLPDEYSTALEKIYISGTGLLGIINDILDMSKIETGKLEINAAMYSVPDLINDTVWLNKVRIGSKPKEQQLKLLLDVDEKLPLKLIGDELRIKQILNNLLSNGIKYTKQGYVKLSVSHAQETNDVKLKFVVEDTGQGIKDEDFRRLFSEYSRFNAAANREIEGTGLGLNITKKLVEMMDGTITVQSEYGKGSVFTVEIRQTAGDSGQPAAVIGADIAEKLRNFTYTGKQAIKLQITPMPYGKVLVVDDVDSNRYVTAGLLSPYKLEIETADSGFLAIENVKSGKTYDIIFMDHMMPQMDGIETTQRLRSLGYKGIIIALTANVLTGNTEMFRQNGFDDFIPKPVDMGQLDTCLHKYIRSRHIEEAEKYEALLSAEQVNKTEVQQKTDKKLTQIFCRDAKKGIETLQKALRQTILGNSELKPFTNTVHSLKSVLQSLGENIASDAAFNLEKAGLENDNEYILANTGKFIKTLEELIQKYNPAQGADSNAKEDTAFLSEQLKNIQIACRDYNVKAAYTIINGIKEKSWKAGTTSFLEEICDMIYLHSDFEGACKQIDIFLAGVGA